MTYAAPALGLDPAYTNTSIDFGAADVGAPVLGLKNAGADGVYLPMAAATNIAVAQGLQQNAVPMKAVLMGTGYGQDLLDSPAGKSLPDTHHLPGRVQAGRAQGRGHQAVPGRPEEVRRRHRGARLRRCTPATSSPTTPIAAMKKAGKDLTRQAFVDGGHAIGQYDQAGPRVSAGRRQRRRSRSGAVDDAAAGRCKLVDDKFQLFPKSGKPFTAEARRLARGPGCQQGGRRPRRRPPPRPRHHERRRT